MGTEKTSYVCQNVSVWQAAILWLEDLPWIAKGRLRHVPQEVRAHPRREVAGVDHLAVGTCDPAPRCNTPKKKKRQEMTGATSPWDPSISKNLWEARSRLYRRCFLQRNSTELLIRNLLTMSTIILCTYFLHRSDLKHFPEFGN